MMRTVKLSIFASIFALVLLGTSAPANAKMFGMREDEGNDITQFTKWESVINKFQGEVSDNNAGLLKMEKGLQKFANIQDPQAKINAINEYINNSIKYSPDSMVWNRSDYWAAPGETFAKGEGDCEDYAIAKFFALRMMGFKDNDMR